MQPLSLASIIILVISFAYLLAVVLRSCTRRLSCGGFLLCFLSAVLLLLGSITAANYDVISFLIKSYLTPEQIDFVRDILAAITNGNGAIMFIEICLSTLATSIGTSCIVLALFCTTKRILTTWVVTTSHQCTQQHISLDSSLIITRPSLQFICLLQ